MARSDRPGRGAGRPISAELGAVIWLGPSTADNLRTKGPRVEVGGVGERPYLVDTHRDLLMAVQHLATVPGSPPDLAGG